MPRTIIVQTGVRYGRLTVVDPEGPRLYIDPIKNRAGQRTAVVRCDCGSDPHPVTLANLIRGNTKSCGCLRREASAQRSQARAAGRARVRAKRMVDLERENAQLRAQLRRVVQGSYGLGAD
jgi:hypothetical protein